MKILIEAAAADLRDSARAGNPQGIRADSLRV
jgi:hypothetical protein